MAEANFVKMYTRDFISLAMRSADGPGLEEALARKVEDAKSHAALMDARKGGLHLEAVVEALESEAVRPTGGLHRETTPETIEARAAFLRRSAALLRGEAAERPAKATRLELRAPA